MSRSDHPYLQSRKLKKKLITIGFPGSDTFRIGIFQMAGLAVPRVMVHEILHCISRLSREFGKKYSKKRISPQKASADIEQTAVNQS